VATRLGLRDALVNWSVIHSIGYAIVAVAGFTWKDADPNNLLVLWGFSVMIAAMTMILGVLTLQVPHWVINTNTDWMSQAISLNRLFNI
jgi:hypothetical protein